MDGVEESRSRCGTTEIIPLGPARMITYSMELSGSPDDSTAIEKRKVLTKTGSVWTKEELQKVSEEAIGIIEKDLKDDKLAEFFFMFLGIGVLIGYMSAIVIMPSVESAVFTNWAFLQNIMMTTGLMAGFIIGSFMTNISIPVRFVTFYLTTAALILSLHLTLLLATPNSPAAVNLSYAISFFLGVSSSCTNGTTMEFAYLISSKYSMNIFGGQAVAGLVATGLYWIVKGIVPNSTKGHRIIICVVLAFASLLTALSAVSYWWLKKRERIRYVLEKQAGRMAKSGAASDTPMIEYFAHIEGQETQSNAESISGKKSTWTQITSTVTVLVRTSMASWSPLVCCFFVFCVSGIIYPGIISALNPADSLVTNKATAVAILISLFQIGDVIGRQCVRLTFNWQMKFLWIASTARLVFLPLFIVTQRLEPKSNGMTSLALRSVMTFVLSFTQGWLGGLSTVRTPDKLSGSEETKAAGFVIGFCVVAGLAVGSYLALITQIGL